MPKPPRRSPRLLVALPACALLASTWTGGCQTDPAAADAAAYHQAMVPLLVENADLSRQFRDLAATIKKKDPDPKQIAKLLRKEFIPTAQSLADKVDTVQPSTPTLKTAHAELQEAWDDRLTAYQDIYEAWKKRDLEAFDRAEEENLRARRQEERYFELVNEALAPYQLSLPTYPVAAQ